MKVSVLSVLVCTYNRSELLRETLTALQGMRPPTDCQVEIIVVDNNSTDDTQQVIAEAGRAARFPIIALRETSQGKSFALNAGLRRAVGEVLALTDDDVIPAADWFERIVDDFRRCSITFVFGKVLPRWARQPPPELLIKEAQKIWGPLAIVDYGDQPMDYVANDPTQRLPIGANLAFAREALVAIGGWRTDLGKVNNTLLSGEDHEIFMRMQRMGVYFGYYDPALTVQHLVPGERLTRQYFRRWFFWHGKTQALMLEDLYPDLEMARVPQIAGIPRFAVRQAFEQCLRYVASLPSKNALRTMIEEMQMIRYVGLFAERWRLRHASIPAGQQRRNDAAMRRTAQASRRQSA